MFGRWVSNPMSRLPCSVPGHEPVTPGPLDKGNSAEMYRLSENLARRRVLYPSPLISAPSVLVIDIPPSARGAGLALGRYYAIVLETDAERAELEDFLCEPRRGPVPPDLLDHRLSALVSEHLLISSYDPPAKGWPWLMVCRWPESLTAGVVAARTSMARGCYSMELFNSKEAMEESSVRLIQTLGAEHELAVRLLAADQMSAPGHA